MNELSIKIESKVLANNLSDFEQQATDYLNGLTAKFETDDDFARAKQEVKELKLLEERTKSAIDAAINDSTEVKTLIESASAIVEKFRKARLERDKLVKSKEQDVRAGIISKQLEAIYDAYSNTPDNVAQALAISMPKSGLSERLQEASKGRRTLSGLEKAAAAEASAIASELCAEVMRLKQRLGAIPPERIHLFADKAQLLAGTDDLTAIVAERIAQEEERTEARRAEEERKAEAARKAEEERAEQACRTQETGQTERPAAEQAAPVSSPSQDEEAYEFAITLILNTTTTHARTTAREIKDRYGDNVTLIRSK